MSFWKKVRTETALIFKEHGTTIDAPPSPEKSAAYKKIRRQFPASTCPGNMEKAAIGCNYEHWDKLANPRQR